MKVGSSFFISNLLSWEQIAKFVATAIEVVSLVRFVKDQSCPGDTACLGSFLFFFYSIKNLQYMITYYTYT